MLGERSAFWIHEGVGTPWANKKRFMHFTKVIYRARCNLSAIEAALSWMACGHGSLCCGPHTCKTQHICKTVNILSMLQVCAQNIQTNHQPLYQESLVLWCQHCHVASCFVSKDSWLIIICLYAIAFTCGYHCYILVAWDSCYIDIL